MQSSVEAREPIFRPGRNLPSDREPQQLHEKLWMPPLISSLDLALFLRGRGPVPLLRQKLHVAKHAHKLTRNTEEPGAISKRVDTLGLSTVCFSPA